MAVYVVSFAKKKDMSKEDGEWHIQSKKHLEWRDAFFSYMRQIRTVGWRLSHEGITLCDMNFKCKVCDAGGRWYDLFREPMHHETHKHKKFHRNAAPDSLPPEDENERRQWEEMFVKLEQQQAPQPKPSEPKSVYQRRRESAGPSSSATEELLQPTAKQRALAPTDASRAFVEQDWELQRPAKRQRAIAPTEASTADVGTGDGVPSSSSSSSSGATMGAGSSITGARPPASCLDYKDPPTAQTMTDAKKRAENVWAPKLPHPALEFGYFRKPNLWVWCTVCKAWVALVEFNFSTKAAKTEDGECPHWTPDNSAKFNADMQAVLNGKW